MRTVLWGSASVAALALAAPLWTAPAKAQQGAQQQQQQQAVPGTGAAAQDVVEL